MKIQVKLSLPFEFETEALTPYQIEALAETISRNEKTEPMLLSLTTPWKPKLTFDSKLKELIYQIIRCDRIITEELLQDKSLRSSVLVKPNPSLSCAVREVIQRLLLDIGTFCQKTPGMKERSSRFHMEVIIAELLSLYPFMQPPQNEKLEVPLFLKGSWQIEQYRIEHLRLTPVWMGSPMIAFGLVPQDGSHPPLLLFRGTGLPTANGFVLSLLTDVNPFASIGTYALALGKKSIGSWLYNQKNKVITFGKSLGGAMACLCALSYPDFVDKVMAIGAPGLHRRDVRKWLILLRSRADNHPKIHHFWQINDRVPYFDHVALNGMHYYQIIGGKRLRGLASHAAMAITQEHSLIIRIDPVLEEKRGTRKLLTFFRALIGPFLFLFFLFLHACVTIIKKVTFCD